VRIISSDTFLQFIKLLFISIKSDRGDRQSWLCLDALLLQIYLASKTIAMRCDRSIYG
jgi:hypothetical protein